MSKAARKQVKPQWVEDCAKVTRDLISAEFDTNPNQRVRISLPPDIYEERKLGQGRTEIRFKDEHDLVTQSVFQACYTLEEIENDLCALVQRVVDLHATMVVWNFSIEGLEDGPRAEEWEKLSYRIDQLTTTLIPLEIRQDTECAGCGKHFEPKDARQIYCTPICSNQARYRRWIERKADTDEPTE